MSRASPWVSCLIFTVLPTLSNAFPIAYSISGVGSGTVGVTAFTGAPYTILLNGDTKAIQPPNSLGQTRNAVVGTIRIEGIGVAAITETVVVTSACGAVPQV